MHLITNLERNIIPEMSPRDIHRIRYQIFIFIISGKAEFWEIGELLFLISHPERVDCEIKL